MSKAFELFTAVPKLHNCAQAVAAENIDDRPQIIILRNVSGFQRKPCGSISIVVALGSGDVAVIFGGIEPGETERIIVVIKSHMFPAERPLAGKFIVLAAGAFI